MSTPSSSRASRRNRCAGVAHRPAGADGEAGDLAVDPVQPERQAAHAQLPPLQLAAQGGEQPQGGGGDVLGAADRLGPADPGRERASAPAGARTPPRHGPGAGRGGSGRVGAEAGEQGRAGQGGELADPAQAQPPQGGEQVRIQPQGGGRQIRAAPPASAGSRPPAPNRAQAQAAASRPATASRRVRPSRSRRRSRSAMSERSPPNRWLQPVRSMASPSMPSTMTRGL